MKRHSAQGASTPRKVEEFAPPSWSYREEARHFLACVRSGEEFHSSVRDTAVDVRLFEEIYRKYLEQRGAL